MTSIGLEALAALKADARWCLEVGTPGIDPNAVLALIDIATAAQAQAEAFKRYSKLGIGDEQDAAYLTWIGACLDTNRAAEAVLSDPQTPKET